MFSYIFLSVFVHIEATQIIGDRIEEAGDQLESDEVFMLFVAKTIAAIVGVYLYRFTSARLSLKRHPNIPVTLLRDHNTLQAFLDSFPMPDIPPELAVRHPFMLHITLLFPFLFPLAPLLLPSLYS